MLGLWHCGPHDSPLETKDVVRSRLLFREDWVQIGVKQLVQRQRHGYVADRRGMASLSSRAANWWRRCWPNAWPFYPSVDTYNMKSPMIRSFSGWWWLEHGCFFSYIGNVFIPTDVNSIIFRRGWLNHQAVFPKREAHGFSKKWRELPPVPERPT